MTFLLTGPIGRYIMKEDIETHDELNEREMALMSSYRIMRQRILDLLLLRT
jgi:hypothetical protein